MEGIFWFVFGALVGMALMPHLRHLADRVRRAWAGLDQPSHPESSTHPEHPESSEHPEGSRHARHPRRPYPYP